VLGSEILLLLPIIGSFGAIVIILGVGTVLFELYYKERSDRETVAGIGARQGEDLTLRLLNKAEMNILRLRKIKTFGLTLEGLFIPIFRNQRSQVLRFTTMT